MMLSRVTVATIAALALAGCSATAPVGVLGDDSLDVFAAPGRSLQVPVGRELRLTIRTIGPGEYASPPEMGGDALHFLDASLATVQVPAGPTQVFRFLGAAQGTTVIRFHNTGSATVVADTVIVR